MKTLLVLAVISTQAFCAISNDKKYKLNQYMGQAGSEAQLGTLVDEGGQRGLAKDGHQAATLLVGTYSFAVQGGATTSGATLGVTIPANAVVRRSWMDVITQPVGSGASLGFYLQNAGDVKTPTAVGTLTTGLAEGTSTGSAANMKKITAASTLKYVITGATLTAGKVKVFVEYMMSE